jgi:hypothetical protein
MPCRLNVISANAKMPDNLIATKRIPGNSGVRSFWKTTTVIGRSQLIEKAFLIVVMLFDGFHCSSCTCNKK